MDSEPEQNDNISEENSQNGDSENDNEDQQKSQTEAAEEQQDEVQYTSKLSEFVVPNKEQVRIRYLI